MSAATGPTIQIDVATEGDWPAAARCIGHAFGECMPSGQTPRDHLRPMARRLCARLDEHVIGGGFAYPLQLHLPGGETLPVAGLAGVGISPAAQGCGAFKPLLRKHLSLSREQGDAASILMASESGLYRRFGYGPCAERAQWQLATAGWALHQPLSDPGTIELIDNEPAAIDTLAAVHTAHCHHQPGQVARCAQWWSHIVGTETRSWFGGGPQFIALHRDREGRADGYALYALAECGKARSRPDIPRLKLTLRELVAADDSAELALFDRLCRTAWVVEINWPRAPVDPAWRHRMADPRQLLCYNRDDLFWLRPLDPVRLLQTRHYADAGEVDLDYLDPEFPALSGRWRLQVADDGRAALTAAPAGEALRLGPSALGMLLLGGTRATELARAGLIDGPAPALRRLDRLMLWDRAPFTATKF